MSFYSFYAEILGLQDPPIPTIELLQKDRYEISKKFRFSKNRIFFTNKNQAQLSFRTVSSSMATPRFEHGIKYRFEKAYDTNDKKRFEITTGSPAISLYLKINFKNRILCNIIHNRYIINRDWFYKTLVAAAMGFLFGFIGNFIGYRQGYQNGLRDEKNKMSFEKSKEDRNPKHSSDSTINTN